MSVKKDETEEQTEKPRETGEETKEEEVSEEVEETVEEEVKPSEKKVEEPEEEEEEDIVEERFYTVPLGRVWIGPRKKHSPKAVRVLRSFVMRHMKVDEESVKITNEVNEKIWSRGIEKPPRKIRVRVTKDTDGIVKVRLAQGD
ncbi:50S ribosomal protein L31e [Candidatus Bathyarchaeota archaeon]|nr:MAG: 50S ribosomal protein L31e [Candidatus Bathyarchaeota archaeon]